MGSTGRERARKAARAMAVLLIAGGLSVLAYVNLQDWNFQRLADGHITEYTSVVDDAGDAGRLGTLEQARAYNEALAGRADGTGVLPYPDQLAYGDPVMMGYIEIPRIGVRQPIYHGTEDTTLMSGIGHLEGSSLPVGGEGTHCVLTGHTGMRNARMLDDLKELEADDLVVLWTLGEPYAYEVTGSETVLPEDAPAKIGIVEGRDLVTLITCTPYGINSHRLLVHGQRCAYDWERAQDTGMEAFVNDRNLPLIVALAILAAPLVGAAVRAIVRRTRRRGDDGDDGGCAGGGAAGDCDGGRCGGEHDGLGADIGAVRDDGPDDRGD